jgi:hypothetical protein
MSSLAKAIPRNASLLIVLTALIVVAPLVPMNRSRFFIELIFNLILLAGVYSVGAGRHRWPFLMLTVATLAVRWGRYLFVASDLDITALALTVIWLFYALVIIVLRLFRRRDVDIEVILSAVVTYLLAAIAFATLFQIVALQSPEAFSGLPQTAYEDRTELSSSMVYFSLVCITTMGYGDIVPTGSLARPLSVIEGVFGQLYLAVMIARLVGLHIAAERDA